jgi:hypothetical protein
MKKMKKKYFSSDKLPKQQSTNFWSQGILGVKGEIAIHAHGNERVLSNFDHPMSSENHSL